MGFSFDETRIAGDAIISIPLSEYREMIELKTRATLLIEEAARENSYVSSQRVLDYFGIEKEKKEDGTNNSPISAEIKF